MSVFNSRFDDFTLVKNQRKCWIACCTSLFKGKDLGVQQDPAYASIQLDECWKPGEKYKLLAFSQYLIK